MIKPEEKRIRSFIKSNNSAQRAFNKMIDFYQVLDKMCATNHTKLIKRIYCDNPYGLTTIKLSMEANMSERTCNKYRREYIDCFFACFNIVNN